MPNFNPNDLNNYFDQTFGKGAYNSGLQQAYKAGQLKQQASLAKSDFTSNLNKLKKAQTSKTYQDALDYWNQNKDALASKGAYRTEQEYLNDPAKRQQIKDAGFKQQDFIDAMYATETNGNSRSKREYNQQHPKGALNKNLQPYDPVKDYGNSEFSITPMKGVNQQQQQPQQKNSNPLGGLLDKLKNSEASKTVTAAEQFFNPFDNVSADQAVKNFLNHKQSNTTKEVQRGANRLVDSASLGLMSNLDKKVNNRTPYYNSARPIGQGGGTDMITSGLGYLVPGVGATKAVKALGLGAKEATGLAKLGQLAKEGAITGGALTGAQTGVNYALNPKDQSLKNNLENIGLGIGLGAVGDPLLHGLGGVASKQWGKLAKGEVPTYTGKPSQNALDALKPITKPKTDNSNPLLYRLIQNSKQPKYEVPVNQRVKWKSPDPKIAEYKKEYQDAVQQQYDYLKSSMGKGNNFGTTASSGDLGNFRDPNGSFNVSNNPKWYQDFGKQNNYRKPTNAELRQMAQDHVQNGFQDEVGNVPAFTPKHVQEIDSQIEEINTILQHSPEHAPELKPILSALQEDRTNAMNEFKQIVNTPDKGLQAIAKKATPLKSGKGFVPIEQQKFGTKLARAETAPENKFNFPYKPGDPLPDTRSHIGTKTEKTLPSMAEVANKGYIKTVDNLHRLSQFDNQVQNVLGRDLKPTESTHMLGLNSRGSDMISKQILTQNMVNKNGDAIGKSLKDITMQVPKGKLKDFEDYLVNKHAITRMNRGEKVFPDEMQMSPEKSKAIVNNYEATNPEFKNIAKNYYDYNKQLGQHWLVNTGVLSKDQWEGYLKANPHYVPNNRIFSSLEQPKFTNSAKKGFANQTNPTKKAVGSQRKIVSPIESTIEHTAQYVKTAKRNEVMQSLINNIKQDPEAFKGWAEILPTPKGAGTFLDSIGNKLKNEGIDGVLEEFNKAFDQKPDLSKGNVVRGLIDGKEVHIKVNDPQLLDALTNLQPKAQNIVIHSLGQVTRVMKNLTTGINPVFSLTRNIFRDIPTAYTNSKSTNNPITFSKDLVQSVISVMKNDKLYRSFKAVGGGHSSPISSDVNLLAQSKQSILPQKGVKPLLKKGLGALENLNNAVEAAPRLAEFKRIVKNGDYNSKMKALYEANDVTVNFNKYGNVAKEIDSVVPYFNAAIQGLDKQGRVFFSKSATTAQKTTAALKAFTGITIPTVILYSINHDNPDYQKVSNYIKDSNFLIPKGDGTFYKIPKPRELGVLFGSDVERTLNMWLNQDPKAFQDFTTTILDNFVPPKRTVLDPFNDLRANKNFMNAPIIPGDLQNVSPQYQYDSKTSEISKKIGNLTGLSPMKLDYLAKSYGGVLGELGIPATAKDSTIGQTLKQKVTVDPVFSNDLQRRFYDAKTKLDHAHNDLSKQGVNGPNLNESLRKQFSSTSTQMGKIRKQMKQVQNDQSLTRQQRVDQVRKLQDFINKLAEQANKNVR